MCSPDPRALPRLPYHVLQATDHVYRGFSLLPAKLRQVGYRTHQIGKWYFFLATIYQTHLSPRLTRRHLGSLESWMTPVGRGFETSVGYLGGGEDHYTQMSTEFGCNGIDLWSSKITKISDFRCMGSPSVSRRPGVALNGCGICSRAKVKGKPIFSRRNT